MDRRERGIRHLGQHCDAARSLWVTSFRNTPDSADATSKGPSSSGAAAFRPPPGLAHESLSQEALDRWERVQWERHRGMAHLTGGNSQSAGLDLVPIVDAQIKLGDGNIVPEGRISPLHLHGHAQPFACSPSQPDINSAQTADVSQMHELPTTSLDNHVETSNRAPSACTPDSCRQLPHAESGAEVDDYTHAMSLLFGPFDWTPAPHL